MAKQDYTEIVFILDRSGSMSSIWGDVVGGLKTFMEKQKEIPGKCLLSLVAFDDVVENFVKNVSVAEFSELPSSIFPRNSTALLDAMGDSINAFEEKICGMPESERPGKVVFIVQTDGLENASKHFNYDKVSELIRYHTRRHDYQFIFLGANMDSIKEAGRTNIDASNALRWAQTPIGTEKLYSGVSDKLSSYRVGEVSSVAFTVEEKKSIEE